MQRRRAIAVTVAAMLTPLALAQCDADADAPGPAPAATAPDCGPELMPDAAPPDAEDPRCATDAELVATHPHAKLQSTVIGANLIDIRGWHGRLYFGYGDIDLDTGPIVISSWDPKADAWQDHLTFETERIERFRVIGEELWAPATDPRGEVAPEYAHGSARHQWSQESIGRSIKVLDAAERVPGEPILVGSDVYLSDAGTFDNLFGAAAWRRTEATPFERSFPIINPNPVTDSQYVDLNELPFLNAAALDGKLYAASVGLTWIFDGTGWAKGPELGGFLHPVTFAERIVFVALGQLWSFDGSQRKSLGIPMVETTLTYTFVLEPLAVLTDSEGRLLVVDADRRTLVTEDLVEWRCVGRAPEDVRSVGSLDGTVYFGGPEGRIYALPEASW